MRAQRIQLYFSSNKWNVSLHLAHSTKMCHLLTFNNNQLFAAKSNCNHFDNDFCFVCIPHHLFVCIRLQQQNIITNLKLFAIFLAHKNSREQKNQPFKVQTKFNLKWYHAVLSLTIMGFCWKNLRHGKKLVAEKCCSYEYAQESIRVVLKLTECV